MERTVFRALTSLPAAATLPVHNESAVDVDRLACHMSGSR